MWIKQTTPILKGNQSRYDNLSTFLRGFKTYSKLLLLPWPSKTHTVLFSCSWTVLRWNILKPTWVHEFHVGLARMKLSSQPCSLSRRCLNAIVHAMSQFFSCHTAGFFCCLFLILCVPYGWVMVCFVLVRTVLLPCVYPSLWLKNMFSEYGPQRSKKVYGVCATEKTCFGEGRRDRIGF